jgi:hypothetical protein
MSSSVIKNAQVVKQMEIDLTVVTLMKERSQFSRFHIREALSIMEFFIDLWSGKCKEQAVTFLKCIRKDDECYEM